MGVRWLRPAVVLAAAAAIGFWLFARGGPRAAEAPPDPVDPPAGGAPELAASPHREGSKVTRDETPQDSSGKPLPIESRVEGTVRRDGKPAPARVELRPLLDASTPYRFSTTDSAQGAVSEARTAAVADAGEDGRFAFSGIAPGSYSVRAVARDGAVGTAVETFRFPGERRAVTVDLAPGTTLRGRVRYADGSPWHGDVLALADSDEWSSGLCVGLAETDGEGHFVLSGLAEGWVTLEAVSAEGGKVIGPPIRLPSADEYTIVWDAERIPVEGRVLSATDRTPIAGAEVVGSSCSELSGSVDRGQTDPDGRFRVLAPSKNGEIHVRARGYVSQTRPVADPKEVLEILLTCGARIQGVVTQRGNGTGVAAAQVTVLGKSAEDRLRPEISVATDGEGRFLVEDLRPGSYSLFARGAGRVSAAFLSAEVEARAAATVVLRPGDSVEITLETVPAARVVGTVLDAAGAGVEGALVFASRRIGGRFGGADEPPWAAYGMDSVPSGRGGVYEITSLVPGLEYMVSARGPEGLGTPRQVVRVAAEVPARLDLVLPPGRWVEVTVLEKGTDSPVPDARLSAWTFAEPSGDGEERFVSSSTSEASARTGAAGRARLGPLGPGDVHVNVEAEGFAQGRSTERLNVVESPGGAMAVVRLERGRSISGRVLRSDGQTATGATVDLRTELGPGSATTVSTKAGVDGAFLFEDLGEGTRTLRATVEADGLASEWVPAPLGATGLTVRLSVLPVHSVVARVLDAEGNPVPLAEADYSYQLAWGSAGRHGEVKDGRLVIDLDEDAPTSGELTISKARAADGTPMPLGEMVTNDVRPGQEVTVRLPPERTIEGRVLGPDGKGVIGARVLVERLQESWANQTAQMEAPWAWSVSPFIRTDESGAYRFAQLGDGPHLVAVLPPPTYAPPPTVRRTAGATGVDFRLTPAAVATVLVLGPDASPVPGAQVVAVRNAGQQFLMDALFSKYLTGWSTVAITGADGRARLEGLDPKASFVLGVRGPAERAVADAVDQGWSPADTTVRLKAGLLISGVALNAEGKPVAGASIECEEANGVSRTVVTSGDGTFRFVGLARGKVRLSARYEEHSAKLDPKTLHASVLVQAGAEGVELRLR